jgi:hypothetical protein
MARVRDWQALTDAYRDRLKGAGLTEQSYNAGASLVKARGHLSDVIGQVEIYTDTRHTVVADEIHAALDEGISWDEIHEQIRWKRQAYKAWKADKPIPTNPHPDWQGVWLWYHGSK